jgi:hypothetical protein
MNKLIILFVGAFLLLSSISHVYAGVTVETPTDADKSGQGRVLISKFKAAHKNQDIDALMKLVFWQDVNQQTKDSIKESFEGLLKKSIKSIHIGPVPKDQMTEYTMGSIHYRINLKPAGLLEIFFSSTKDGITSISYVVGQHGKEYLIATAAPMK